VIGAIVRGFLRGLGPFGIPVAILAVVVIVLLALVGSFLQGFFGALLKEGD
jgi:hypothetical protein